MSRLTVLFCALLCVGATLASPNKNAVDTFIDATKQYIDDRIDEALETLQETAVRVRQEAEKVLDNMKERAAEAEERIEEKTAELTKKLDSVLDEGLRKGVNVDDCRKLLPKKTIETSAQQLSSDTKVCVNKNIEEGANLVRNMSLKATEVLEELEDIKAESDQCVHNISGYFRTVKIGNCIAAAHVKAVWAVTKRVPAFLSDQIQLSGNIAALPFDLALCSTAEGLSVFQRPFETKLKKVERCVSERIANKNSKHDKTSDSENASSGSGSIET